MKVGILGGTFDPIHNAHIEIAKEALKQFDLDKVVIMPTPNPPHKDKSRITSNFHRINMIKLALNGVENIEFSDFELYKCDVTYTADTLYMLNELHPENQYYFIVGSDSIASFMSWYRPDVILKYATLIAVKRDDESSAKMEQKISEIENKFSVKIGTINMKSLDISSSFIRTHSYDEIKKVVPLEVANYIRDNNLYIDENKNVAWSISKILEDLQKVLKSSRFEHTLGAADTAKEMAEIFHVNPNKAYLAGILHDCAKHFSDDELLNICVENNIDVSKYEKKAPYLLHGKVGAFLARTKYGITDSEVISAIIWHTTGRENMTDLEKIVFSADYIEPGRNKQPNLDYLRKVSKEDLDLLTYSILRDTINYLKSTKNMCIDINTLNAYEYYKEIIEAR